MDDDTTSSSILSVTGNEPRKNFLRNRITTLWNNLPKEIALLRTVNSFKSKLDLCVGNLRRNTHINSKRASVGEADYLIL